MKARSVGFTLTEMAIVLLVVALLLGSVISTVSTQLDLRNNRDTQARLDQIKEALIGFAQANGRLPCPADGTLATGTANAGVEQKTVTVVGPPQEYKCTDANGFGVVPWATLGISETDVWGRRFSYKVSSEFSDSTTKTPNTWGCGATIPVPLPTQASIALCAQGTFTVTTRTATNKVPGTTVLNVPVVIISHGKNGYGAYTPDGKKLGANPDANAVDEPANANAASLIVYSREQSPPPRSSVTCSDIAAGDFCEFDDLVAYIPANVLVTKMVSAGKLP